MNHRKRFAPVTLLLSFALMLMLLGSIASGQAGRGTAASSAATADRVNLNTATQQQLEELPGVGAATAKKIIAGRPYKTVDELSKAGISQSEISKLTPLVSVGAPARSGSPAPTANPKSAKPAKIDLNTASQSDLEELPGVVPATAKKIIAARPYKTVDDLSKAGVSKTEIENLASQVTVGRSAAAVASKVDLNTASQADLEELPGVGPATAKKIIAARPYKTVDELSKAGVSKTEIEKLASQVSVGRPTAAVGSVDSSLKKQVSQTSKVDLNSASQSDLEELPGVGPATAKKIVAGRPYKTIDDLSKAGVSTTEIARLTPLVSVGTTTGPRGSAMPKEAVAPKQAPVNASPAAAAAGKVNLNSATQAQLEELPGVGPATAKKIIAARPIKNVDDLEKAGISKAEVAKLSPLVIAGAESAEPDDATPARVPPKAGMVWVNTDSKIFHRAGDRWYGKTKQGQFMTEQDAIKQGYRESK